MSIGIDNIYATVKLNNRDEFDRICAFASTFGEHDEEISIKARYQVEKFCMELASKQVTP